MTVIENDLTRNEDGKIIAENGTIVLHRRKIEKGGLISFCREGVKASLYFNKTMFAGEIPTSIKLTANNLTPIKITFEETKPKKKAVKKKAKKKSTSLDAKAKGKSKRKKKGKSSPLDKVAKLTKRVRKTISRKRTSTKKNETGTPDLLNELLSLD